MDIPKSIFISNRETELQRLIHTAKQTWSGFYGQYGFKVLPFLIKNNPSVVYLPYVGFEKINDIDNKLTKIKLDFPVIFKRSDFSNVDFKFKKLNLLNYKRLWAKKELKFWKEVSSIFPDKYKLIKTVEIRITSYGSISSYQFLSKHKNQTLIVYLRFDADISHLAEAILTSILCSYKSNYESGWMNTEYFVDLLLSKSNIKNLFPGYQETLKSIQENDRYKINEKSEKHLRKLSVKSHKNFSLIGNKIYLNNKLISGNLTPKQFLILKYLIKNDKLFIATDELYEIVWGLEESKYSLWAATKIMQRLRKNLISLGADKYCLKTVRGRGYILNN